MAALSRQRLQVPGSVLLLGEYAVLCPGGLGVALAVQPCVSLSWQPAEETVVECLWGNRREVWTSRQPRSALVRAVVDVLGAFAAAAEVTVDSRAFSDAQGRKRGLGSSAAAAVALTALWLRLAGGRRPSREAVFDAALRVHRHLQGGRGSGYDVACSCFGGWGLFTGGRQPTWQAVDVPEARLQLVQASRSVSTGDAIGCWQDWRRSHPVEWHDFLNRSNERIRAWIAADSAERRADLLREAARAGRDLGRAIGCWDPDNDRAMANADEPAIVKAVGAGNELWARWLTGPGGAGIPVAREGLRWS